MVGALVGAGLGIVGGLIKTIGAKKAQKKAQKALDNYKRQTFDNAASALQVDTLGAEMSMESGARDTATMVEALRKGGSRGFSALSDVAEIGLEREGDIRKELGGQRTELNKMIADDAVTIRGLQEEREKADLAGLGQQLSVATANKQSGISDMFSAASGGMGALFGGTSGGADPVPANAFKGQDNSSLITF